MRTPIVAIAILALTAACAPHTTGTPEVTLAPQSAEKIPSAATPLSPSAERPTLQSTPGPTPPLPNSIGHEFFLTDLLLDNRSFPNCELPCWQGLRASVSKYDDVLETFDSVFGFNNTLDFSESDNRAIFDGGPFKGEAGVPSVYTSGYQWLFDDGPHFAQFSAGAWLDSEDNTLQGLDFFWETADPSILTVHFSLQPILQQMGSPSNVFIEFHPMGAELGEGHFFIVYESGLVLEASGVAPMSITSESRIVDFCLDEKFFQNGLTFGRVMLLGPFDSGMDNLSPLQEAVVGQPIERLALIPIEEWFGITLQKFMQAALEDNACLDLNLLHGVSD